MISNARVSPASLEPHDLPDHAVALRQDVEIAIAGLRETYIHPAFSGDAAGTGQRFTLPSTRVECLFHQAAKAGVASAAPATPNIPRREIGPMRASPKPL